MSRLVERVTPGPPPGWAFQWTPKLPRGGVCSAIDADELLYPKGDRGFQWEPGRRLCQSCPVQGECLSHALTCGETFGMWGGLNEGERANLRTRLIRKGLM